LAIYYTFAYVYKYGESFKRVSIQNKACFNLDIVATMIKLINQNKIFL